ncbi:MAG: (2Fe-2S)-binding protein [Chloroflexus sp.]|nr:(2Fe-2S)-binding protein [Chloroflexus sp.]MBO9339805.1 (2Fe-2S)-binding protein [Chloroflexus sp.]
MCCLYYRLPSREE